MAAVSLNLSVFICEMRGLNPSSELPTCFLAVDSSIQSVLGGALFEGMGRGSGRHAFGSLCNITDRAPEPQALESIRTWPECGVLYVCTEKAA